MNIKVILLIVGLAGAGGYVTIKQHDATVKWKALSEQRQEEIVKKDKTVEAFKMSVESLGTATARMMANYARSKAQMRDSISKLLVQITNTSDELLADTTLSDTSRAKVIQIVNSCRALESRMSGQLTECEHIKDSLNILATRKDTLLLGLTRSRDDWKKEALKQTDYSKGRVKTWVAGVGQAISAVLFLIIGRETK
jgi:hypothetical protein